MLIKRGLGNEVFLKIKIWEIFTFRRRCSIDLLINVNLRYRYPARYLHLLFLCYFHNTVYKTVTDSNLTVQIQFKSDDMSTFIVSHIIFHNSRYRYAAVSCMERFRGKVRQNVEALLSLFSKYKLFVYGVEL